MSRGDSVSENVRDIWSRLNSRWRGDDANVFHKDYVLKLLEISEEFEAACRQMESMANELMKNLQEIEQRAGDQ